MNKKIIALAVLCLGIVLGSSALVSAEEGSGRMGEKMAIKALGSTLEVHIFADGKVLVRGAKVDSVSGNTISASTVWGSADLDWTVNVDFASQVIRRSGGSVPISEIKAGDFISFSGDLVTTSPSLAVNAKIIKDWSIEKKKAVFIGQVASLGNGSFVLNAERGQVTVNVASTTSMTKGDAVAAFSDIHVGDKVQAIGLYDEASRSLQAEKVRIYVEKGSEQHAFEGTLKAISGTVLPVTLTLALNERADVTVNVPAGVSVLNRSFLAASIADFRVGDKVRVWGLKEGLTIDATVVRDLNLPR